MPRVIAEGRAYNKPRWGQQFSQLPAAGGTTPESEVNRQIQTGRQQIQDKYALQWKEVNRSKRFIGAGKAKRMLQEIDTKAKQEMLQFNQKAQEQIAGLNSINRLAEQGFISPEDAARVNAGRVFGTDVANRMYPTPGKEPSIPEQFGKLDVYSHRISQELENFRIVPGKKPSRLFRGLGFVNPLIGAVSAYHNLKRKGIEPELEIWDPTIPAKDPKTGEDVMGDWRKVEPEEVGIYETWLQEEKDVAIRKRELLGQPDISRRRVQPDTRGGTFSDKVTESVRQQPTQRSAPKVIRQRNKTTGKERISYDGGRTWQMTG